MKILMRFPVGIEFLINICQYFNKNLSIHNSAMTDYFAKASANLWNLQTLAHCESVTVACFVQEIQVDFGTNITHGITFPFGDIIP